MSNFFQAMCEQLPYLKSLGIGALILEGLFEEGASPLNLNGSEQFGTLPQIKHLIEASDKAGELLLSSNLHSWICPALLITELLTGSLGLKMVLDLCELNLLGPHDVSRNTATVQVKPTLWSCYKLF